LYCLTTALGELCLTHRRSASEPPAAPFEVTVIKPSAPDEKGYGRITGNQIETRAIPLRFLINFGWDINPDNQEGIANAPKWLDTKQFDITAKAGANMRVKISMRNQVSKIDLQIFLILDNATLISPFNLSRVQNSPP
jgi:Protein of unknown function (DUF3738)